MKTTVLFLFLLLSGFPKLHAQDTADLLQQGKVLLDHNKTMEAIVCFEKVLEQEPKNYDALVYLCNYYFLAGQQVLDSIETDYLMHESPSRMQFAKHLEDMKSIYERYFSIAERYLIQAYLIRRNDYLDTMAGQIADFKEQIGIPSPGTKKKKLKQTLLP